MKKILIIFSLILSLFINIVPVQAMSTYANYTYFLDITHNQVTADSDELTFNIKDLDGNIKTIKSVSKQTSIMVRLSVSDLTQNSNYILEVYYLDELYSTIEFTAGYSSAISLTLEKKEDIGDSTESTESSESSEGSESSENTSSSTESTEESGGTLSEDYLKVIHNDLLILILIIGFFEFMKMIQIIVRNISGGDR